MCTVTYIPSRDSIYIASNRDEMLARKFAEHPAISRFNSGKILFPKDGEKGGTWIGAHSNGNAMVLLNGGFERHIPNPPYARSRGLVFLDVFDADDPVKAFDMLSLDAIEPFTLVLWDGTHATLHEMRWDGELKYIAEKDKSQPHIWSSATLYDKEVIQKREQWFEAWLHSTDVYTVETISGFHEFGGEGDKRIDIRMSRGGILQTVSTTVIECSAERSAMYYKDMITGVRSVNEWLRAANDTP